MKLLQQKWFLKAINVLSPLERLEVFDLLIKAENNIPYIEENISQNIVVILYRYIKKYEEHKKHISDIRRSVRWVNKDKETQTIVKKIDNNCTENSKKIVKSKKNQKENTETRTIVKEIDNNCTENIFPPCPWKDTNFPIPDISLLGPAPKDYSPSTPWFWDIFITLDIDALNNLPMQWHQIAKDIDDRIGQLQILNDSTKWTVN